MNIITPKTLQTAIWKIGSNSIKFGSHQTIVNEYCYFYKNFSNSSASLNSNNFQSETTYLSTYKNLDNKEFGKHKRKSRRRIDQRTAPKCVNNTIDKRNKIKLIKKIRNPSSAKEPPLKDENDPPIKKYLNLFHIKCGLLGNTLDRYCWKIEEHLRNIMSLNCSTLRLKSLNTIERLLPVYHYRLYQNNFKDIFQVNKFSKYIPKSKIKSKSCNELIFFTPIKNSNNFLKLHNTSLERIQTKYSSDLSNNIRRVHIRSCIKIVTKWLKNNKSKHDLEIPKGNNKNNIIHIKHPSKDFKQHTEVPVKITEDPNKIIIRLLTGNLMNESNTSIKNKISSKTSLHSKKEIPNPLKLTRNAQQTTLNSQNIIPNTEKIFFNNRIAIFEPKILILNPSILHSTKSDQTKSPVATIKSKQSNKRDIEKSTLNLTKVTEKSMKKTNSSKATSSVQNISDHTKKVQRRKKKQGKPPSESIIIADKIISKPKKTAKNTVTPPAKKTLQQVTIDLPCNKTPIKSPTTPPKTPTKTPKKLPEGLKGFKNSSSGNKSCSNNDCDDCIIEPWKKHDVDDVEDSVNNTPWSRREAGLPTRPSGCFDPSKGDECKKNKNCKFVAVEEKGEFIWHKIIGNEAPTWIYPNEVKVNNNFNIRKNPFIVTERSNLNFKGLEIILPTYLNGGSRGTCSKSGVKDTCVETNQCGLKSSRDTWAPVEIKKNFDQTGIPQEKKTDDTSKNKCSKFISIIKDTVSALMTIFAVQKPREEGVKTKPA